MSASNNWPIYNGPGLALVAANPSASVRVSPIGQLTTLMADDVMIDNPGPSDVFVRAGDSAVAATALDVRVPANSLQPFRKGQTEFVAAFCASGTQVVTVHVGDGA